MDYERKYTEAFDHRRDSHIINLEKLASITNLSGLVELDDFPGLKKTLDRNTPISALNWSILMLWLEATECFVLEQFQSCILTCGAVLERCLKLEYDKIYGELPEGKWPLGKCISNLSWDKTRVTKKIISLASDCLVPRNSCAHALLEHSNPKRAILGGNRGIYIIDSNKHIIQRYKGEAERLISNTYQVLSELYSKSETDEGTAQISF